MPLADPGPLRSPPTANVDRVPSPSTRRITRATRPPSVGPCSTGSSSGGALKLVRGFGRCCGRKTHSEAGGDAPVRHPTMTSARRCFRPARPVPAEPDQRGRLAGFHLGQAPSCAAPAGGPPPPAPRPRGRLIEYPVVLLRASRARGSADALRSGKPFAEKPWRGLHGPGPVERPRPRAVLLARLPPGPVSPTKPFPPAGGGAVKPRPAGLKFSPRIAD